METFGIYFGLGLEHILDINGLDHILFILALAAVYTFQDWRRILVLVTAFTIGHSITLALATLKIISVRAEWVEFIIPVTILITAISNFFTREKAQSARMVQLNYGYALFFGLIHGLGFSNTLRALLGANQSITSPLFAFNVGLEVGQIIIVVLFLFLSFIVMKVARQQQKHWTWAVSSIIVVIALFLFEGRLFWM